MHVTIISAEKILAKSGASIAPPARIRQSAIAFVPSQAVQVQSVRLQQTNMDISEESSKCLLCPYVLEHSQYLKVQVMKVI